MSIPVQCPDCATAYKVSDTSAGKKLKCKTCHATIEVPQLGEELEEAIEVNAPRNSRRMLWAIGISVAIVILVTGMFFFFSDSTSARRRKALLAANDLIEKRLYEDAQRILDKVISESPSIEALHLRAVAFHHVGHKTKAQSDIDALFKLPPSRINDFLARAQARHELGAYAFKFDKTKDSVEEIERYWGLIFADIEAALSLDPQDKVALEFKRAYRDDYEHTWGKPFKSRKK